MDVLVEYSDFLESLWGLQTSNGNCVTVHIKSPHKVMDCCFIHHCSVGICHNIKLLWLVFDQQSTTKQTPELNKREMWIYSNQGGLIPGLLAHLVCNWPCCCKDDAEGLEDCWRLSYIHPAWQGLWGKSASKTSQRGLQSGIYLLSFSISFSLFLVDSLFVMNKNIAWHLPDALSVRGRRWGDMIEILVKRQEVIWTGACRREGMVSVCSCLHSCWDLCKMRPLTTRLTLSPSLCEYLGTDPQLTDIAAYVKSARGHYPDLTAQTQNICPAESHEANWPPLWETVFMTAERLFCLQELKIWLALKLPRRRFLAQER